MPPFPSSLTMRNEPAVRPIISSQGPSRARSSSVTVSTTSGAPRRDARLAEVLGDLRFRVVPKEDAAGFAQTGGARDLVATHHQRDLRPAPQEVLELHHHLAAGRLVQLTADVLAG